MAKKSTRSHNDANGKGEITENKALYYLFEKEQVEKEAKHFWIADEFISIADGINADRKWNTGHEQLLPNVYNERFLSYSDRDKRTTQHGFPILESHTYGWLPPGLHDMGLSELNFIRAPKCRCDLTIYGEKLLAERNTERPSFNGLRFFLR